MLSLRHAFFTSSMLLALLYFGLTTSSSSAQVYRCNNSYSTTACTNGKVVDVAPAVQVPVVTAPVASLQQRAERKERKKARDWERTERELDKAQANETPARQNAKNSAACAATSRRIQKIDELARRGGSAPKMEQLRKDRKATRDKQFRLGC